MGRPLTSIIDSVTSLSGVEPAKGSELARATLLVIAIFADRYETSAALARVVVTVLHHKIRSSALSPITNINVRWTMWLRLHGLLQGVLVSIALRTRRLSLTLDGRIRT